MSANLPTSRTHSVASYTDDRSDSRAISIASTNGGTYLHGEYQTVQDFQEHTWPLQCWHGGESGTFPRSPYESYLNYLTQRWPHLVELQNWMSNSSKSPYRRRPRQHKLPTTIIDIRESAAPIRREFPDDTGARDNGNCYSHLAECLNRPTPTSVKGRLIVVPYLQPSLVNVLGSSFDLDPDFFHGHLGFQSAETTDPLPSDTFLRIVYDLDSIQQNLQGADLRAKEQRISVYVNMPGRNDHWTAVILFNIPDKWGDTQLVLSPQPTRHQPHNYLERPKFGRGPGFPEDFSSDYIHTLLDQAASDHKLYATDPFFVLHYLYSQAVRIWATTINSLNQQIKELEYNILDPKEETLAEEGVELKRKDPLLLLRSLRTASTHYESTLASTLEIIQVGGKPEWKSLHPYTKHSLRDRHSKSIISMATLERDYSRVLQQTRDILREIDNANSLLVSRLSVLLSHRGIEQNELLIKQAKSTQSLTQLALLVLPLTLVANIFSMNIDDMRPYFNGWVFLAAATIATFLSVFKVWLWRILLRWFNKPGKVSI